MFNFKKIINILRKRKDEDVNLKENEIDIKTQDEDIMSDEEFKEVILELNPRSIIIAKTPGYDNPDPDHYIRYFLVLGKDEENLYCAYMTTNEKYIEKKYYYKYYNSFADNTDFIKCNRIYKIGKEHFVRNKKYCMPYRDYNNVIEHFIKYSDNLDYIDFNYLNYPIKNGAIILKDNKLYLVINKIKNTNIYNVCDLLPIDKNGLYVFINNTKYIICLDNISEIKSDDSYTIIGYADENVFKKVKNTDLSDYEFSDILRLKNGGNKVIYLTQIDNVIYYATFEQLELFTGISKIESKNVEKLNEKLADKDLARLIRKIEKPLVSDTYPMYYGAKKNILGEVKKYKNN